MSNSNIDSKNPITQTQSDNNQQPQSSNNIQNNNNNSNNSNNNNNKRQKRNLSAQFIEDDINVQQGQKQRNQSNNDFLDGQQDNQNKKIKIGICAMEKKSKSKPMLSILNFLKCELFEIIIFEEETILYKDIKRWPKVDVLISWYSDGFPLKKAQDYAKLVNPYQINDLEKQEILWDRSRVYELLTKKNIKQPPHYFVRRNNEDVVDNYYKLEEQQSEERNKKKQEEQDKQQLLQLQSNNSSFNNNDYRQFNSQDNTIGFQSKTPSENSNIVIKNLQCQKLHSNIGNDGNFSEENCDKVETENSVQLNQEQYLKLKKKIRSRSVDVINSIYNDTTEEDNLVQEFDDFIMVGQQKLKKPFVEKPFDAEDHNIYIYYANADGGGCKKLFRKVNNQSSSYDKDTNTIRKEGNYIYQEFLPTDGFDIKVYTVGTDYAHAESRKAPALDGIVRRTSNGKEFRYPIQLTFDEKCIAKNIVKIFGQSICGFDLLRSNGKSYVIDVNGWSFVKGNEKYNEDCAQILKNMILQHFNVGHDQDNQQKQNIVDQSIKGLKTNQYRPQKEEHKKEELRAIVAIFRHGDRTPKQKMKVKVGNEQFIKFFMEKCDIQQKGYKKEIKVKNPKHMMEFLEISEKIYKETMQVEYKKREKKGSLNLEGNLYSNDEQSNKCKDDLQNDYDEKLKKEQDTQEYKLEQLVTVLKMHGSFEGFNRKIQIKPIEFEENTGKSQMDGKISSNNSSSGTLSQTIPTKLLIILKWGGELTHAGEKLTEEYGRLFRFQQYGHKDEGLLRLHNTYRHDLKTFTSDEGRCQKTAGHFIQGLLETKGDITSTISSLLIRNDTAQRLLDYNNEGELEKEAKQQLSTILNSNTNLNVSYRQICGQNVHISERLQRILNEIGNPLQKLTQQYELVKELEQKLYMKSEAHKKSYYINYKDYQEQEQTYCQGESISLIFKRWRKLKVDYKQDPSHFNISKIPDIYDNIKYDIIHNKELIEEIYPKAEQLYHLSELLASFVVPCEFGLTEERKYTMAQEVVGPLCDKIKNDLNWWKDKKYQEDFYKYQKNQQQQQEEETWRHVRTRLYFTNASHLYSMFNVLYIGLEQFKLISQKTQDVLDKIKSLQYLSHIIFRLYEDLSKDETDESRFRLELSLSEGMALDSSKDVQKDHEVRVKKLIPINIALGINEIEEFFNSLQFTTFKKEEKVSSPLNINEKAQLKKISKSSYLSQKSQDQNNQQI